MIHRPAPLIAQLACGLALAACTMPGTPPAPGQFQLATDAPPQAAPGTCWGKTVTPAIIETVERDVLVQPAQISTDGRIQQPPIYKSETRTEIVEPRREDWQRVPCTSDLSPDLIASLQRALTARGFYAGPPTGEMDRLTQAAIRRYQAENGGPDSGILTVRAARSLGLWTVDLSQDPA